MFRKIVSNLPFSPSLVGQLGFYASRLKKEETTRRLGLIFTALALVVQSFAVFHAPEAANAASTQDILYGGFSTKEQLIQAYDSNKQNFKDLLTAVGITRDELQATTLQTVNSKGIPYSFGRNPHFSAAQGERQYNFPLTGGGMGTVYYQPLALWDTLPYTKQNGSTYQAYGVRSAQAGYFWIMLNCGNLNLLYPPRTPPCPTGTTGVYPNCAKPTPPPAPTPKPTPIPVCPSGTTGVYPNCVTPTPPPQPIASCSTLQIIGSGSQHTLNARATADNGATIKSYTYTISRDGQVVDTKTNQSTATYDSYSYTGSQSGTYTVKLSVNTSLGVQTSQDCVQTFTVAPPEVCPQNPSILKSSPECQPCPGDTGIWIKDSRCAAKIVNTKSAINTSQGGKDATTVLARAGNRITYTITSENTGLQATTMNMEERLSDILEYATLIDKGTGTFDEKTSTLTWNNVAIAPKSKQSRTFVVQLNDPVSSGARGTSNGTSYDCIINNTYGNAVAINVDCPAPKQVENVVAELPHTGATENLLFAGSLLAVVVYFYARARQLKKEVRLIRRDFNAGTI